MSNPATVAAYNAENQHADLTKISATGTAIHQRLGDAPAGTNEAVRAGDDPLVPPMGSGGITCPYPDEQATQRVIEAVLVALETRAVTGKGTDYGHGRYDPDGLMLALLAPTELVAGGLDAPQSDWDALDRNAVQDIVKTKYGGLPQPMTLRVAAGDCLRLRYVNAMESTSFNDGPAGLADALGDAILPPITPLNADPKPQAPGHLERVGILTPSTESGPVTGLRPSAQLALNVALPGMDMIRDLPLGYGYGGRPLPAGLDGKATVSRVQMYYAGRMRLDMTEDVETNGEWDEKPLTTDELAGQIAERIAAQLKDPNAPWLKFATTQFPAEGDENFLNVITLADDAVPVFSLLGVNYGLTIAPPGDGSAMDDALFEAENAGMPAVIDGSAEGFDKLAAVICPDPRTCFDKVAAREALQKIAYPTAAEMLNEKVHWIPYAFGAAPIRSTSDVISHVQHGLFGSIDVVPSSWNWQAARGQKMLDCRDVTYPGNRSYQICPVTYDAADPLTQGDGSPALYLAEPLKGMAPDYAQNAGADPGAEPGEIAPEWTREFVLYYQDGLNLWDDDSDISWRWDKGIRRSDSLASVKMLPDCPICDDSYDRGEKGISYRSPSFAQGLSQGRARVEESDDLNAFVFAPEFLKDHPNAVRLQACAGEQVVIRVVHPGGRARQRAFVMNGSGYDDLFPGFGFPNAAMLAPGKSISAWLSPEIQAGTYLWHDGPTQIRAGGVWGLLEVSAKCDRPGN